MKKKPFHKLSEEEFKELKDSGRLYEIYPEVEGNITIITGNGREYTFPKMCFAWPPFGELLGRDKEDKLGLSGREYLSPAQLPDMPTKVLHAGRSTGKSST